MNRRTMILAAGAVAVFGLYLLDQGYTRLIEKPMGLAETQLAATRKSLGDAKAEQVSGRRLANRLEEYAERALPHDPALARAAYQKWLLGLVERHQMGSVAINAETPQPIEVRGRVNRRQRRLVGHTIRYGLRARTTLAHWADFLDEFRRSAHLHKVTRFAINPVAGGSEIDLTATVEALSLDAAPREETLSEWVRVETPDAAAADYRQITERNLFARGISPELAAIRLGAITRGRGGIDQAWFRVGRPAKTQIVKAGESLSLPLHSIQIRQIETERVLVAVNDVTGWLRLGESLGTLLGVEVKPEVEGVEKETGSEDGATAEGAAESPAGTSPPVTLPAGTAGGGAASGAASSAASSAASGVGTGKVEGSK